MGRPGHRDHRIRRNCKKCGGAAENCRVRDEVILLTCEKEKEDRSITLRERRLEWIEGIRHVCGCDGREKQKQGRPRE